MSDFEKLEQALKEFQEGNADAFNVALLIDSLVITRIEEALRELK